MTSVRSGVAFMLAANAVFAATQFLMLVALTRATSPEIVGRYALALAITAPMYFAANLKLRQVAISDTSEEFTSRQYVGARVSALVTIWLALAVVSTFSSGGGLLLGVSTLKALDLTSDILYTLPHRMARLGGVAASMSVRAILSLTAFTFCLTKWNSVESAVWGAVTVYSVAIAFDYLNARRFGDPLPICRWSANRALFLLAAPLGLAMATSSFGSMLPRYLLQATQGSREVGVYSAIASLMAVGGLVINSVGQAISPRLVAHVAGNDLRRFRSDVRRLTAFGTALGLVGVALCAVAGAPLLGLLFGAEYESGSTALLILALGATVSYSAVFSGTALNALRRFDVPLPVTLASAAITAALLVPATVAWGIEGAAAAVVGGACVELLLYRRAIKHEYAEWAAFPRIPAHLSSAEPEGDVS